MILLNKVLISGKVYVCPTINLKLLNRFASNFDWGRRTTFMFLAWINNSNFTLIEFTSKAGFPS